MPRDPNAITSTFDMSERRLVITAPYIGAILSVNHYKIRGRYTRTPVRMWMGELSSLVRLNLAGCNPKPPVRLLLYGAFKDNRRPDLDNLHKVIGDAIETGCGINDRDFLWSDEGWRVGEKRPFLRIVITFAAL